MNYYYNENYYSEISDISEDLFETEEEIHELPDDYRLEVFTTILKPIVVFDPRMILDKCVDEDMFSEENADREDLKIHEALKECIDFEKLNSMIPKLYYPDKKIFLTKKDFVDELS